jgi:hypothetical protein
VSQYRYYTYDSPFIIKRWLHKKRYSDVLHIIDPRPSDILLDYGCGDGFLLKNLSRSLPAGRLYGYEPAEALYDEACLNLTGTGVTVSKAVDSLKKEVFTKITCLETCEHLDSYRLEAALAHITSLLALFGIAVFSVPIEIGLPALLKNTFRFFKNNEYDNLSVRKLAATVCGRPVERTTSTALSSLPYIFSHVGFDHRAFEFKLGSYLSVVSKQYSPLNLFGSMFNSTVFYVCRKYER